ncbi:MAG: VWA domain-containing protein [Methylococcales bacterium]|nr:VWA domain-containing protein [Methylococcales bacterium]
MLKWIKQRSLTRATILLLNMSLCSYGFAAGLLTPANGQLPSLKIKQHDVNVTIEAGYAMTEITQIFHNPHAQDLNALYSFPIPEKAAVAEFTLWIDGHPVTGEVLEKQKAQQIHAKEKSAGRETGLTEKNSHKIFEIHVSPVRAGQDTKIRLVYLQPAHMDSGIGRYLYPLEEGGTDEQELAFWTTTTEVTTAFSFKLILKSEYPIEAVRIPNHPGVTAHQNAENDWIVEMHKQQVDSQEGKAIANSTQVFSLDKDILVYWRHQAGLPGSVDMVTYKLENKNRGTFMLTFTPGDDLKKLTHGSDWIFVLDISGSMSTKYATLADAIQRALGKMRADDRFKIILFNDRAQDLTSGYVTATAENIRHYSQAVAQVKTGHGTNLYRGIASALKHLDADRTSAIVLVTDGVANIGEVRQRQFIQLLNKKDIRLFTFIMGNGANKPLLEAMTNASNGFAMSISNSDDIVGKILQASSKVTHQNLHDVKISINGIKTANLTPNNLGSLYRGQQLIVFGHYFGSGDASVQLTGKLAGHEKSYQTQINFPHSDIRHPEIERLWAYANIEDKNRQIESFGEKSELKQAIIDLAIEYGLVTDYTSMIVVRDELFDHYGIKRNNKSRLNKEHMAQKQRASQPKPSYRVDQHKPMFKSPRAGLSGGGGGSMDISFLVMLIAMLLLGKVKVSSRQIIKTPS